MKSLVIAENRPSPETLPVFLAQTRKMVVFSKAKTM